MNFFSNMTLKSLFIALTCLLPLSLFAEKVLVVDLALLTAIHPERRVAIETIRADMESYRQRLDSSDRELGTLRTEVQRAIQDARAFDQNPMNSDASKQLKKENAGRMLQQFEINQQNFAAAREQFNNTVNARLNEATAAIHEEVARLARKEARKRGASLLLDKSANKGIVVYNIDAMDITDEIKAIIEARNP
jgi:Skp family chaperone for outer membrane proteins